MWRWQSSRTAVVGAAIVVFVVCCVLPVGYLLTVSLSGVDAFSALLLDARQRQLLYNTALLGTGTALLATAIGAPLGIALARIALPRKAIRFLRRICGSGTNDSEGCGSSSFFLTGTG